MTEPAILETALYAPDLDAAEAFYGTVLGLPKVTRAGNRHVFFRLPAAMLLIFNSSETERPPADPTPSRSRPTAPAAPATSPSPPPPQELDRWRARLEAAGISIEADFRWPGSGARSIYVRDPAGNSVEFAEPRLWGFGEVL